MFLLQRALTAAVPLVSRWGFRPPLAPGFISIAKRNAPPVGGARDALHSLFRNVNQAGTVADTPLAAQELASTMPVPILYLSLTKLHRSCARSVVTPTRPTRSKNRYNHDALPSRERSLSISSPDRNSPTRAASYHCRPLVDCNADSSAASTLRGGLLLSGAACSEVLSGNWTTERSLSAIPGLREPLSKSSANPLLVDSHERTDSAQHTIECDHDGNA